MEMIDVWLIWKIDLSGRGEYLDMAYSENKACTFKCDELLQKQTNFASVVAFTPHEFLQKQRNPTLVASFTPHKFSGEVITNNRVIVNNRVYSLDKATRVTLIVKEIFSKLTEEQRDALDTYYSEL